MLMETPEIGLLNSGEIKGSGVFSASEVEGQSKKLDRLLCLKTIRVRLDFQAPQTTAPKKIESDPNY